MRIFSSKLLMILQLDYIKKLDFQSNLIFRTSILCRWTIDLISSITNSQIIGENNRSFDWLLHPFFHFRYLADLNEREYKEKIYRNIFEHLEAIRITLAACQLKMKAEPIKENMLVTPDTYASTITTKALQQLTNTAKDLQLMLINKNGKPKSQWLQWIAGGSVIIGCIAIYKCILKK